MGGGTIRARRPPHSGEAGQLEKLFACFNSTKPEPWAETERGAEVPDSPAGGRTVSEVNWATGSFPGKF